MNITEDLRESEKSMTLSKGLFNNLATPNQWVITALQRIKKWFIQNKPAKT